MTVSNAHLRRAAYHLTSDEHFSPYFYFKFYRSLKKNNRIFAPVSALTNYTNISVDVLSLTAS